MLPVCLSTGCTGRTLPPLQTWDYVGRSAECDRQQSLEKPPIIKDAISTNVSLGHIYYISINYAWFPNENVPKSHWSSQLFSNIEQMSRACSILSTGTTSERPRRRSLFSIPPVFPTLCLSLFSQLWRGCATVPGCFCFWPPRVKWGTSSPRGNLPVFGHLKNMRLLVPETSL